MNERGFGHGFDVVTCMALVASEVLAPATAGEGGEECVRVRARALGL